MKKERVGKTVVIRISIMWLFVLSIVITSIVALFKNHIFAANDTEEVSEVEQIVAVEKNQNAVNVLEVMVENNYSNKKLVNEEREVEYVTEMRETDKLPKGEEMVQQKGKKGKEQVTAMQTYQEDKQVGEEIVERVTKEEPITEIVYVGTSEFLSKYNVHLGSDMYLIETGDIKKEPKEDSEKVYSLRRYLNVTLDDISGEWVKVKYKNYEGYIQKTKLTSESVTPKIAEKNRIAKLQDSVSLDMDLSKPSGLTLSDYKTIFTYNENDKNAIFADNAITFYNIEKEYNINGIFVASIGIHESAWGTSKLAKEKYNLFGYRAYDREPGKNAQNFENYEDCIETVAKALANNYLTETGKFYNGATLAGVNTKYASDKDWSIKVFNYMEYLYDKLG